MLLLTIQSWKRLYETHWVNIFSETKIDISHYFVGYLHYFGAVLAILIEAPGFAGTTGPFRLSVSDLTVQSIATAMIFLWASHQQLVCATILGDLRRNVKGKVVSYKHKIPEGGMFEWLSAPHLICEIVMYAALTMILLGNSTWLFVFGWVLINQVSTPILEEFFEYYVL
ncbi:hypothetical protein AAG570_005453 [Ranatra chinensis]|uniref:Polyprenal reductase n=1 Tax=Ranatra chinensis TaxID=642074 RepID=A0ABD0XXT5_9HEMI